MQIQIKKLCKEHESPLLFNSEAYTYPYPEIEGSEVNFIEDYEASPVPYDIFFVKEHGEKYVDLLDDTEEPDMEDLLQNWDDLVASIVYVYLPSWAHQYYTLNIAYNPVFNVEEHIESKYGQHETDRLYGQHETDSQYGQHETDSQYGQHETDMQYGQHETDTQYGQHETDKLYGATSDTLGTHTDTSTAYSVSFDDGTEKETGKTSDVIGSQTNTSLSHTDTETSKLHTDTETSKQHTDTETSKQHTDTVTSKQHTDTVTSKQHTDTETSKQHTDTVDRTGNIGVKSASALAQEEILLREKQIFFKNIFLTISREIGAYYDNYFI